jgi:hypothetical protein
MVTTASTARYRRQVRVTYVSLAVVAFVLDVLVPLAAWSR